MARPLRWVELHGPQGPGGRSLWVAVVGTGLIERHEPSGIRRGHGLRALWLSDEAEQVLTLYGDRGDGAEERPADAKADRKVKLRAPRALELLAELGIDPSEESLAVLGLGTGMSGSGSPRLVTVPEEQRLLGVPREEWPDSLPERIQVPDCRLAVGTLRVRVAEPDANSNRLGRLFLDLGAVKEDGKIVLELDRHGVAFRAQVVPPEGGFKVEGWFRLEPWGKELALRLLPERLEEPLRADWLEVWGRLGTRFRLTRATLWARLVAEPGSLPPALMIPLGADGHPTGGNSLGDVWLLPPERVSCTLADQATESQRLGPESVLRLVAGTPPRLKRDGTKLHLSLRGGNLKNGRLAYHWQDGASPVETVELPDDVPLHFEEPAFAARLREAYGAAADVLGDDAPVPAFLPERRGWIELLVPAKAKPSTATESTAPPPPPVTSGFVTWGLRRAVLQPAAGPAKEMAWSLTAEAPTGFEARFTFGAAKLASVEIDLWQPSLVARGLLWASALSPDMADALPRLDDAPASLLDLPLSGPSASRDGDAEFVLTRLRIKAPALSGGNWDDGDVVPAGRRPSLEAGKLTIRMGLSGTGTGGKELPARLWRRHPSLPAVQLMPMTRAHARDGSPLASRQLAAYELRPTVRELKVTNLARPLLKLDPAPSDAELAPADRWLFGFPGVPLAALSLPGVLLGHKEDDASLRWAYRFDIPLLDEALACAELPPVPGEPRTPAVAEPPATALARALLGTLWQERHRARSLVDTERALAFKDQPIGGTRQVKIAGVLEPWLWPVDVTLKPELADDSGELQLGRVAFRDPASGTDWEQSGDAALIGPAAVPYVQPTSREIELTFKHPPPVHLLGWSVADRAAGGRLIDGRGVAYAISPDSAGERLRRGFLLEGAAGPSAPDVLLTARKAMELDVGSGSWRFGFTDLPARKSGTRYVLTRPPGPGEAEETGRLATLRDGWSWRLDGGQSARPLRLHGFSFVASELVAYEESEAGEAQAVRIRGRLHLPRPGDGEAELTDNPVTLSFAKEKGAVRLVDIAAETGDKLLRFRLPRLEQDRGTASVLTAGVRLSVDGSGPARLLNLDRAHLTVDLFGTPIEVPLECAPISAGDTKAELKWKRSSSDLPRPNELALKQVQLLVDLRDPGDAGTSPAHALVVEGEVQIASARAVRLELVWSYPPVKPGRGPTTKLWWLGNLLEVGANRLVPSPRGLALTLEFDELPLVLLAGEEEAPCRLDGAFGLAVAASADVRRLAFPLAGGWVELVAARGGLTLTHLIWLEAPGRAWKEMVRLDGTWSFRSAIEWPALAPPALGKGDERLTIDPPVEGGPGWLHKLTLHLQDHILELDDGSAGAKALTADSPKPGLTLSAPVELVVEAEHELVAEADGRRLAWRAVQRATLGSGEALAKTLEGKDYTFTATYRRKPTGGNDGSYAHAGVAQLRRALAGLHDERLVKALKALGPKLAVVAGQTVLLREREEGGTRRAGLPLWSVLHLPCVAGSPAMSPIPHGFRKAITVTRQDALTGLEWALDPGGAESPVALLSPPGEIAFPPLAGALGGVVALPGRALAAALDPDGPQHVEQAHMAPEPGTSEFVDGAPPFPRALLALAAVTARLAANPGKRLEVLSFLPSPETAGRGRGWLLRPPDRPVGVAETVPADEADIDLIVAGRTGLARVATEVPAFKDAGWNREAEAAAARVAAEPAFVIARRVVQERGQARPAFELARIRGPELLDRPAAPLRAAATVPEPVLGWPAARADAGMKPPAPPLLGKHKPFQDQAAGIAGLAGTLVPPRLAGIPFTLAPSNENADEGVAPPWLAETSRVAFVREVALGAGAPATAGDGRGAARAFLPSLTTLQQGLAEALGGAGDRALQPVLPAAANRAEINPRPGVLRTLTARVLTPDPGTADAGGGLRASPGPATARSYRTPRPVPLPPNRPDVPGGARRPWGWPGEPATSCMIRPDPSDVLLPDDPGAGWAVLVTVEEPDAGRRAAGLWDGAVLLRFEIRLAGAQVSAESPALWLVRHVFSPLAKPDPGNPSMILKPRTRARLRRGTGLVTFSALSHHDDRDWFAEGPDSIAGVTRWRLRRQTGAALLDLAPGEHLELELDLTPPLRVGSETEAKEVLLVQPRPGDNPLAPADQRRLSFALRADPVGAYATALAARAVLFGDPAYDAALSAVPIKREMGFAAGELDETGRPMPGTPERRLEFVVDRPACNPGDELVLAVTMAENAGKLFGLAVQHRPAGGEFASVAVLSETGVASLEPELGLKDVRVLPLTALVPAGGRGDPLVLRPGAALRLTARPLDEEVIKAAPGLAVTLQLDVVDTPVLPLPEAAYGLLRVHIEGGEAECPLYAGDPRAARIDALDPLTSLATGALARRGRFRWRHVAPDGLEGGYFLMKADATGSTHLPESRQELVKVRL